MHHCPPSAVSISPLLSIRGMLGRLTSYGGINLEQKA